MSLVVIVVCCLWFLGAFLHLEASGIAGELPGNRGFVAQVGPCAAAGLDRRLAVGQPFKRPQVAKLRYSPAAAGPVCATTMSGLMVVRPFPETSPARSLA